MKGKFFPFIADDKPSEKKTTPKMREFASAENVSIYLNILHQYVVLSQTYNCL